MQHALRQDQDRRIDHDPAKARRTTKDRDRRLEHTVHHANALGPDASHFRLWIHIPLAAPAQCQAQHRDSSQWMFPASQYRQRSARWRPMPPNRPARMRPIPATTVRTAISRLRHRRCRRDRACRSINSFEADGWNSATVAAARNRAPYNCQSPLGAPRVIFAEKPVVRPDPRGGTMPCL